METKFIVFKAVYQVYSLLTTFAGFSVLCDL